MPRYKFPLANGRSLVLEGDTMPSDADVEAAATQAGVRALLMSAEGEAPTKEPSITPSMGVDAGPLGVGIANAARRGVERVGLQVATSPNLSRAVSAASRPAAGAVARAIGATGGLPGYILGEAVTNPSVLSGAERAIRGGAGLVARIASSPFARAMTGAPGIVASMAFDPGDRPVGETAERTAARQTDYAHRFKAQVNREAGYEVITGTTTPEIIASIARYRSGQ